MDYAKESLKLHREWKGKIRITAAVPVEAWGLTPLEWKKKLTAKHIFTHVEWRMTGYLLTVRGEAPGLTWVDAAGLEALAVPSAFAKFREEARRVLEEADHA